jgi:hypothetical protein
MDRREEFLAESLEHWGAAIASVAGSKPTNSMTWNGIDRIQQALHPFMGTGRNHAHYPSGGGMDFIAVETAAEPGCLSFSVDNRAADIVKPRTLTLEYFADAPLESFLFLELDALRPSGVYENTPTASEELVEYPEGEYLDRVVWDQGYLAHDENDREIPLPPNSRLVTRWFGGAILIVAKGSLWNGTPATYDGRHNTMTPARIRAVIERSLANN